jgi:ribosomal protein S15P/S13E
VTRGLNQSEIKLTQHTKAMALDKAREEFEQFEKRAALAEKQIAQLAKRIAALEESTHPHPP